MELFGLVALALVAGVVSFSSPCVLPLLPGYVSFVSRDVDPEVRRVDPGAVLFVIGFATVFVAMGLTASALGLLLRQHLDTLTRVGGAVVIVMGLAMTGVLRLAPLARERRPVLRRVAAGRVNAAVLGAAFALGWTPCVGPVLSTILVVAASSGDAVTGAMLLAVYALGLGVPFLVLARLVRHGRLRVRWLRANGRRIEIVGGVVMMLTGVLMVTGTWTRLMAGALAQYARLGWPPI